MEFCERLNTALRKRDWRQADLARAVGLTAQRVSLWANGTGTPSPYEMLRISRALNVSLEWLCDDESSEMEPVGRDAAEDERTVLAVYRAMRNAGRLDMDSAVAALATGSTPVAPRQTQVGHSVGPPPSPTRKKGAG